MEKLWLCGIARIDPRLQAAEDGGCVLKTVLKQNGRRTGAGFFAGSGAVGDDPLCFIEFAQTRFKFFNRNVDCA